MANNELDDSIEILEGPKPKKGKNRKQKIEQLEMQNNELLEISSKQKSQIQNLQNELSEMVAKLIDKEENTTPIAKKYASFKRAILPPIKNGKSFEKYNVKVAGRRFDPDCPYNNYIATAEAHFYKMLKKNPGYGKNCDIESIDIINNLDLEAKFVAQKEEFREAGIDTSEILAFHGTPINNIDSILEKNLNKISRTAKGHGYYFSEYPATSRVYGDLILFRVLPGREWINDSCQDIPEGYDSKKVFGFNGTHGKVPVRGIPATAVAKPSYPFGTGGNVGLPSYFGIPSLTTGLGATATTFVAPKTSSMYKCNNINPTIYGGSNALGVPATAILKPSHPIGSGGNGGFSFGTLSNTTGLGTTATPFGAPATSSTDSDSDPDTQTQQEEAPGDIIVIKNEKQFMPFIVYHLR